MKFDQGRKFVLGMFEVFLVEEALDNEHPRGTEEGIDAERLTGLVESIVPVLTRERDIRQPLVKYRGPGINGDGLLGGCEGGSDIIEGECVRQALIQDLLIQRGRFQYRVNERYRLRGTLRA